MAHSPHYDGRYDACVVGAGITGAAVAYELVQRGLSVALIDKVGAAGGPSGASAGMLRQHYEDPGVVAPARFGCEYLAEFEARTGFPSGFVKTGYVAVGGEDRAARIRAAIGVMRACGCVVEELDVAGIRALEPRLAAGDLAVGAYEPTVGTCEPLFVADGYARAAARDGATLLWGRRVQSLRASGEGFQLHLGTGERLLAGRVAVCAGGFANPLVRDLGGHVPITLVRVQAGRWCPPHRFGPPGPIVSHHSEGTWFRPDGDDGHYLVGARGDWLQRGPYRRATGQAGADLRELERLSAIVARRFPLMAGGVWRGSWSSFLDFTPDGNPVVDLVPGRDNLLVATGMSGHGFKLVPAYGIAAAELLTGGKVASFAWDAFSYARLRRGTTRLALGRAGTGTG